MYTFWSIHTFPIAALSQWQKNREQPKYPSRVVQIKFEIFIKWTITGTKNVKKLLLHAEQG